MGGMRGFAWLVVGLSCRPHSTGGSVDAGNRQGEIEAAARGEKIRPLRFARPVTAARMEHGIGVVARDRATGELAFAEFDDNALVVLTTVPLPAKLDDPELLVSSGDLAVLARAPADGGRARVSLRIAMGGDGGATVIDSRPVGSAACSTLDGVYSLERDGAGWRGSFRSLTLAGGEERGPRLGASSEVTIVCGQHRAFVVVNGRGEQRVVAWAPEGHDARPTILPKPPLPDPDEGALMAAKGDELVVAKIQKSTLATLVLQNNHGAIWRVADVAAGDGLALETLEPGEGVTDCSSSVPSLQSRDAAEARRPTRSPRWLSPTRRRAKSFALPSPSRLGGVAQSQARSSLVGSVAGSSLPGLEARILPAPAQVFDMAALDSPRSNRGPGTSA